MISACLLYLHEEYVNPNFDCCGKLDVLKINLNDKVIIYFDLYHSKTDLNQ